MKKTGFSHIRKWLFIYLAAMMFSTIIINLLIYVEIGNILDTIELSRLAAAESRTGNSATLAISGLRLRVILLISGGFVGIAVLGYIWMGLATQHIVRPVRKIGRALSQLARGKLNETVDIEYGDEFGQIGAGINELAANLQELLLYIWKQTGQCLTLLEQIQNNPDMHHDRRLTLETLGYLKQLAEAVDDLREMAKAYVFYDVSLEGDNTQAIDEPGKTHPSDPDTNIR